MAVLVISYSRADQLQVRAVVGLLRAAMRDLEQAVFWDGDFDPGDRWFDQLKDYIDKAPQLFVFWCEHSAQSAQVRRELSYALERQKRVIPVLLDNTPLSAELAPLHGIDLRDAVTHRTEPSPPPPSAFKRAGAAPSRPVSTMLSHHWKGLALLAIMLIAPLVLFLPTRKSGGVTRGTWLEDLAIWVAFIAVALFVMFCIFDAVRRLSLWRRKRRIVRAFAGHLRDQPSGS